MHATLDTGIRSRPTYGYDGLKPVETGQYVPLKN
jgi:hypothetical protein